MRIIKISLFLIVVMLISTYTAFAAAPKVSADKTTFDILSGTYKLDGNVRVETDRFTVTADKAQVNLTSLEVWAQNNINCTYGRDGAIKFTGSNLRGSWADKTITVTGGTHFTSENISIKAERTSFNWDTKIADFSGDVIVKQDGKTTKYTDIKYNVVENKLIEN